jgi:hypothetical protein
MAGGSGGRFGQDKDYKMKKINTQYSIIEKREPLVIETGPSKDDGPKKRPFDVAPNSPNILTILNILNSGRK